MTKRKTSPADDPTPRAARARILADAAMRGDKQAAQASGVNVRTLHWWRNQLATDTELDRLYEAYRRRMAAAWQPSAGLALAKASEKLAGMMDRDELDAMMLLAVARTFGEILVTQGALSPEEDTDARHAGSSGSGATEARPPAPETKH